ncbi:MAG: UDP-N-acetylmuramoyl-L-alanyl-D-glutamate--2,6-diaminopimelate ligase [Elusimicrobiota bacterium]
MKLKEVLKGTELSFEYDIEIEGIAVDSREVKKNFIFFAFKGEKDDGKKYIEQAIEKGASFIIADEKIDYESPIISVSKDIMKTLSVVSKNFYKNPSSRLYTIGITGTKGKTTTTFLIEKILNELGRKTGVIGTINYRTHKRIISEAKNTTPFAHHLNYILNEILSDGGDSVVMEVSSHSLVLKKVDDIEFDMAIFTNLQSDHLDFHKTLKEYSNAKLKLFEILNLSPKKDKVAILNLDDPFSQKIIPFLNKDINVITYSIKNNSQIIAKDIELKPDKTIFTVIEQGKRYNFETKLIGLHNVYNFLAAIASAKSIGFDISEIAKVVKKVDNISGRLEKIVSKKGFYIYIDYAHTEESLRQVLETLNLLPHRKILTVFGCGGDRDPTKRAPMGKVACQLSDMVYITSDNPRTEDPLKIINEIEKGAIEAGKNNYVKIVDRKQAIESAIRQAKEGDIILIAGKGHENYQIIGNERKYFSDRETTIEILKKENAYEPSNESI